jgi:hypothetical protein
MCKEMPVILVNRVVDPKRIIGKNGGPRWRRGTSGEEKMVVNVMMKTKHLNANLDNDTLSKG